MRISKMGVVATLFGAVLCGGMSTQNAVAACKSKSCAQNASKSAKATTGKRLHHASVRTRTKTARLDRQGRKDEAEAIAHSKPLPPSIANARAELAATDKRPSDDLSKNLAATDNQEFVTINGVQIAASTQLNDMDRTVAEQPVELKSDEPKPDIAVTQAEPPQPATAGRIIRAIPNAERPVLTNTDTDTWNKTSLVGKIFVAFGSLLTLASAARLMLA